jgi:hypothetical protein
VGKGKKGGKGSSSAEFVPYKEGDIYVPIPKIDEAMIQSDKAPSYTFKPNRLTMHMLIKRAVDVNYVEELFCETVDGYKRMKSIHPGIVFKGD